MKSPGELSSLFPSPGADAAAALGGGAKVAGAGACARTDVAEGAGAGGRSNLR